VAGTVPAAARGSDPVPGGTMCRARDDSEDRAARRAGRRGRDRVGRGADLRGPVDATDHGRGVGRQVEIDPTGHAREAGHQDVAARDHGQGLGRHVVTADASHRGHPVGRPEARVGLARGVRPNAGRRSVGADRRRAGDPCPADRSRAAGVLARHHRVGWASAARHHSDPQHDRLALRDRRGSRDRRGPLCRAAGPSVSRPAAFLACPPSRTDRAALGVRRRGRAGQPCPTSTVRRQR
jgi:hypothetical protein